MKRKIILIEDDSQATWHGWTKLRGILLAVVELENGEVRYIDPVGIKFIDGPTPGVATDETQQASAAA